MTIEKLNQEKCTGCGTCYNICKLDAIRMIENDEGFLYPSINHDICIKCGMCSKSCPELNLVSKSENPECYAMMAEDKTRKISSSGGMFTILAKYVLERKGVICGASFDDGYKRVKHIIITKEKDLNYIRGSKYVQSDINTVYRSLEAYLKKGKYVLFTGTPCQVAGFKNYLGKDYPELILADIVCHGVPSPKVMKKYIDEKAGKREIEKLDFREKSFWGWGTATSLFFKDGSSYRGDCYQDKYWRAFLGGLSTRKSCGECHYASPNRVGDFSLGDFWGVAEIGEQLDDKVGTSLVFANTEKAKVIIERISSNCKLMEKIDKEKVVELAKTRNGQLLYPKQPHWARKHFFELLNNKTFNEAFDWALNSRYDVGITGWWYNENYGGALTYYALHQVLVKMGLSVLMIAKCTWDSNYKPKYDSVPYRFALKNYNISKNHTPATIAALNNHCKTFISGSDQLFNPTLWEYSGPQYFLNYVSGHNNLVSYASSFGNGFVDVGNLKINMSYWLHRFDALSVRESYGVDICNQIFGLDAVKVMDPVFLCDVKEYEKQAKKSGLEKKYDYMLSFLLDPNEEKREAVKYISKKLSRPYINLLNAVDYERNAHILNLENTKPNIDIEEWLFYYMNTDFIITDSFHGTCFAIIFRKRFISIANLQRGENRFISVLEDAGLLNHLVYDYSEISNRKDLFEEIDYDAVYDRLNPKIRESYEWLEKAIKHPKKKEMTDFNVINSEIERLKREIDELKNKIK